MTLKVMRARDRDYNLHLFEKVNARPELTDCLPSQPLTSHNTLARLVTIQGNRGITPRTSGKRARACRFS